MEDVKIEIVEQLDLLEDLLLEGTRIPFSGARLVNENETAEVLDHIRHLIPNEIPKASRILNIAESYIQQSKVKSKKIIDEATEYRDKLLDNSAIQAMLAASAASSVLLSSFVMS